MTARAVMLCCFAVARSTNMDLSRRTLAATAGATRPLPHVTQGLAFRALREIVQGRAADLIGATENIRSLLSDSARRSASQRELSNLHGENLYALIADLPTRTRRPGTDGIRRALQLQEARTLDGVPRWRNGHAR
jgi:hypothetical protein